MQSGGIVGSEKLEKTRLREARGLKYFGWIRLGGSFWYPCTPTYSLVDHFGLEGCREVFTSSSSIFLFDNTSSCFLGFAIIFPTALSYCLIIKWLDRLLSQNLCLGLNQKFWMYLSLFLLATIVV